MNKLFILKKIKLMGGCINECLRNEDKNVKNEGNGPNSNKNTNTNVNNLTPIPSSSIKVEKSPREETNQNEEKTESLKKEQVESTSKPETKKVTSPIVPPGPVAENEKKEEKKETEEIPKKAQTNPEPMEVNKMASPIAPRRSSLRGNNLKFDPKEMANFAAKKKRNSVSFNISPNVRLKAMFNVEQPKNKSKEEEEKDQKFREQRRKSIKNEFAKVKELIQAKPIEEIAEEDEEGKLVMANKNKNIQIGKEGLNMQDSDSEDSKSESNSKSENESENKEKEESKVEEGETKKE